MTPPITRRRYLASTLAASLLPALASGMSNRPKRILLRGSWQTVNIGDVGHTPGALSLLQEYLPEAEVTLWPSSIGDGAEEMLRRDFPKLKFAKTTEAVDRAVAESDFLLHGSCASFGAQKDFARWRKASDKPYGLYGITLSTMSAEARALLDDARFLFLRDSASLAFAKSQGLKCPVVEFGPDAAFGVKLRDDARATAFLREHNLEEGQFVCVIPRLRYTPYWIIRKKPMTDEDRRKHARSEEMKEHDHAPLRAAIAAVTRQTPMKVLVCPEDESQVAIGKAMIVDRLPEDVRSKVVWRDRFWLPDEALSTYVRSAGLFGLEMHSPIMAVGNGVPAIVCRFSEQTSKGLMWRDIGLGDWLFDMDEPSDLARITETVLAMVQDPVAARRKVETARAFVRKRQRETMGVLSRELET